MKIEKVLLEKEQLSSDKIPWFISRMDILDRFHIFNGTWNSWSICHMLDQRRVYNIN